MNLRRLSLVLALAALAAFPLAGCSDTLDASHDSPWQQLTGMFVRVTGNASIWFEDARHGWRVSPSYSGIWETTDGGRHWQRTAGRIQGNEDQPGKLPAAAAHLPHPLEIVHADQALYVAFNARAPGLGEAVPKEGRGGILVSYDDGHTWRRSLTLPSGREWVLDLSAPEGRWVYALCGQHEPLDAANEFGPTYLLRSENGGRSWQRVWAAEEAGGFSLIQPMILVDGLHGLSDCISTAGRVHTLGQVTTADGGRSWKKTNLEGGAHYLCALDAEHAWTAGGAFYDGGGAAMTVFRATSDGGQSWRSIDALGKRWVMGIFFVSPLQGWAIVDGIFFTADGGRSWVKEAELPEYDGNNRWTFCRTDDLLFATSGDLLYRRKMP